MPSVPAAPRRSKQAPPPTVDRATEAKPKRPAPTSPLDVLQRYVIPEAAGYLRISESGLWKKISLGEIRAIRDGKRTYIPGSEIARMSTLTPHEQVVERSPAPGGRDDVTGIDKPGGGARAATSKRSPQNRHEQ